MQIRSPSLGRSLVARGEIAVAVQPRLAGRVDAGEQRRLNAFAGRALTAPLLHAEQNHRSRRIARLNRALSAGVVEGLGLAFFESDLASIDTVLDPAPAELDLAAPRRIMIDLGLALDAAGEELVVPQALQLDALDLPLVAPPWLLDGTPPPPPSTGQADGSVLAARRVGASLREALRAGRAVPRVGLVMLQPIEHWQLERADPFDQCERDLEAEAFEDQQRRDAGRLLFYAWPDEWLAPRAPDAAWRNRLAYQVFGREAALGAADAMPWFEYGVPLALVAFNAAWRPLFADRGAVVRAGGRPRGRALLAAGLAAADPAQRRIAAGGDRFLWQARIDQLSEHLAEARLAGTSTEALAAQLRLLPPAGLLPVDAIDVRRRLNRFFASTLDVYAAPLPLEQLDLLLEEAAGLAPIDLTLRDRLCLFVPVPQAVFEPDLLVIEQADPTGEIGRTLTRFVDARADWLRRRQNLRHKGFALQLGIDGAAGTPTVEPLGDDPLRLEDEASAPQVPPPPGLMHRSARADGMHQHYFEGAPTPLTPAEGDVLFAWVLVDREHPPQQVMLQFFAAGGWEHRAYWGANLIAFGTDGTASRLKVADELPPPGVWTRLAVPAAALGLAGQAITGMAFTQFGGRSAFGAAGTLRDGAQAPWLTPELLAASTQRGDGEAWDAVAEVDRDAPFEPALGTSAAAQPTAAQTHAADALVELLADKDLQALKIVPPNSDRAQAPTLAQMIAAQGLRATVADLAARVNDADDVINLGFLRVQTDLYRLRQTVLKQTQATRFAVSPALTQIAELDSASATREQLADFYQDVRADKTLLKREAAVPGEAPRDGLLAATALRPGMVFNNTAISSTTAAAPATFVAPLRPGVVSGPRDERLSVRPEAAALAPGFRVGADAVAPPTSSTVVTADPLTGKAEIRTTSIAARLERPRSIEAKDFSVATRADIVAKLAALGLDMDELDVPGIALPGEFDARTGQPKRAPPSKLKTLRASNFAAVLTDPDPRDDKADESAFFFGGVDVSDYSIALLRGAEGIVRRYRDALERMRNALAALQGLFAQWQQRAAAVARELAEARQDVATARALLAEEIERARALNAHRDAVIAEHVKFLAYARTRVATRSVATPSRRLDSALEPDTVPACLAEHGEPPQDVAAMLLLLKRAPLDWFPAIRPHLQLIDQPAFADRLLAAVQPPAFGSSSAFAPALLPAFAAAAAPAASASAAASVAPTQPFVAAALAPAAPAQPLVLAPAALAQPLVLAPAAPAQSLPLAPAALAQPMVLATSASKLALKAQGDSVGQARAAALPQLQAALQAGAGLRLKVDAFARSAGLADLLAAAAERSELQRRAAQEFERIEAVASCLHARLSQVRAAIRLQWAERFSRFDAVRGELDLGDLGALPRFAELPRELREDIVELAGWLRGRADRAQAQAVALMADLVRVCVLAASHSPAGELVSGRIVRPLPLNPGLRLEVRPLLPDRVRVGMAVQFFDAERLTARAVVEDLAGGIASVKVTQTSSAHLATSLATAVHFVVR